jgi:hypothetical protein
MVTKMVTEMIQIEIEFVKVIDEKDYWIRYIFLILLLNNEYLFDWVFFVYQMRIVPNEHDDSEVEHDPNYRTNNNRNVNFWNI